LQIANDKTKKELAKEVSQIKGEKRAAVDDLSQKMQVSS